jgi:hypothetical protein
MKGDRWNWLTRPVFHIIRRLFLEIHIRSILSRGKRCPTGACQPGVALHPACLFQASFDSSGTHSEIPKSVIFELILVFLDPRKHDLAYLKYSGIPMSSILISFSYKDYKVLAWRKTGFPHCSKLKFTVGWLHIKMHNRSMPARCIALVLACQGQRPFRKAMKQPPNVLFFRLLISSDLLWVI